MKQTSEKHSADRTAAVYNGLVSLFWSALALVPLAVFGYTHFSAGVLWLFTSLSLLPFLVPNRLFDEMRMRRRVAWYRRLGVRTVLRLAQNGALVNRLVRRRHPSYKVLQGDRRSRAALLRQTFWFEKFHWALLLFFGLTAAVAASGGHTGWCLALVGINLFYNVYPILLQQYLRTKLGAGRLARACSGSGSPV